MGNWWKKLVANLTGDHLEPGEPTSSALPNESASSEVVAPQDEKVPLARDASMAELREQTTELYQLLGEMAEHARQHFTQAATSDEQVREKLSRIDADLERTRNDADSRMQRIIHTLKGLGEDLERRFTEATGRHEHALANIGRAATGVEANSAEVRRLGEQVGQLQEQFRESGETLQRLDEVVENLPELAAGQAQTLDNLDQRLGIVERRTEAVADAADVAVRSINETKEAIAELRRYTATLQEAQAELATHQRQIAESLNALLERTSQIMQIFKVYAQKLKQLADAPQTQQEALRTHVSAEMASLAGLLEETRKEGKAVAQRGTLALIAAAIAALAGLGAAIGAFLR